jgi:hypothetical protein
MIPFPIIGEIINGVTKIADDLITSDEEQSKIDIEQYKAETERMSGQVEINKIEAASSSRWDSGWRPAVGWVCALTLALAYIPKTLAITVMWSISAYIAATSNAALPVFPELGISEILGLLMALLGMGVMRSFDKKAGTSR